MLQRKGDKSFLKNKFLFSAILLIITSILILSCSKGDLSRSKAEKLIKEHFGVSVTHKYTVSYHTSSTYWGDIADHEKLQKVGMVTVTKDGCCAINTSLTPEGRKYLISEEKDNAKVKTYDVYFKQITGMLPKEENGVKSVQVNYEVIIKNTTPFNNENCRLWCAKEGDIENKQAMFVLYDDGWRITAGESY